MVAPGDRARWLREARDRLAEDHGQQPGPIRVTIEAVESGARTTVEMGADAPANGHVLTALSPLERDILRVVGKLTLPAKVVAHRLGRKCDSSLRLILANLCERDPPPLEKATGGYRVPTTTTTTGAT